MDIRKFILFAAFIIGLHSLFMCSKAEPQHEELQPLDLNLPNPIEEYLNEYGISLSDAKSINGVQIIDSVQFVIAVGRKNNNAWIAKFDQNKKEVFSVEIKNFPDARYSTFNTNSFVVFNKNISFLMGWNLSIDDPYKLTSPEQQTTFLCTINFDNGDYEIIKTENPKSHYASFRVNVLGDSYVIGTYYNNTLTELSKFDANGGLLWERDAIHSEKDYWERDEQTYPLSLYKDFVHIKGDLIVYKTIDNRWPGVLDNKAIYSDANNYCSIVDLKEPKVIFGFNRETVPILENDDTNCVFITKISCSDNVIYMEYKTCKWHDNYDPITNQRLPDTYTDVAKNYYKISTDDYSILEHGDLR